MKRLLVVRDSAAAVAFGSVALTGTVPLWCSAIVVVALGLSLVGVHPLARQRRWTVLSLLLVAVGLVVLTFRGYLELPVAAVSFTALVLAHRLAGAPGASTDAQVLLAALLLTAGAATLSGDIWFALCLVAFTFLSCSFLCLSILSAHRTDAAPALRQVGVGMIAAVIGACVFFVVFPRVSWNLAARRGGPGVLGQVTGLSDRVSLTGSGNIKTNPRAVAKVKIEPDPLVRELGAYWIARRLTQFNGTAWLPESSVVGRGLTIDVAPPTASDVIQTVEILPAYGSPTLVAIAQPTRFTGAFGLSASGQVPIALVRGVGDEVHFAADFPQYSYRARSSSRVRADEPQSDLLTLPPLDKRIASLARTIVGDATEPHVRALRLETYLKRNYSYALDLDGDVQSPLANFLFDSKRGHCEYFATALAVMLRSLDIPSRVVIGFYGGSRVGDRYVLRAGDAHAWVEAYVPGRGWETLDSTPDAGRAAQPQPFLLALSDLVLSIEEAWRSRVVDYAFADQAELARSVARTVRPLSFPGLPNLPRNALIYASLTLVVIVIAARIGRRSEKKPRHPATKFLDAFLRRLHRVKLAPEKSDTLDAVAERLSRQHHPLAGAVDVARRRYFEARFGRVPLRRGEARWLLKSFDAAAARHRATRSRERRTS